MQMTILAACEACAKMGRCTNCCDVEITESIMHRIVPIVAICVGGFLVAKLIDVCSNACQERRKKKWEKKEADWKKDRELLDKKLEIMKALCYNTIEREESHDGKITKKYVDVLKSVKDESKDIENYLKALEAAQQKQS